MTKMLGQDILTQNEFDAFVDGALQNIKNELRYLTDDSVSKTEFISFVSKTNNTINKLSVCIVVLTLVCVFLTSAFYLT